MGGYVLDGAATTDCAFCPMQDTNTYLATVSADYEDAWRNWGILWVYNAVNIAAALGLYWWVRVPKKSDVKKDEGDAAGQVVAGGDSEIHP
ncbi:hypothetical protein BDW69DRAFT_190037 [Aspergillus filifer]